MPHPRAEIERLLKAHQGHALLGIHAAILGPHYSTLEVALHDFRMARELGLIASLHQGGGPARTPDGWERLEAAGLLGDAHQHRARPRAERCAARSASATLGMSFSAAAESEMSQGHGHPLTGRLRRFGRAPSLGVDLESVMSGDMLTQARIALGIQRSLDNVALPRGARHDPADLHHHDPRGAGLGDHRRRADAAAAGPASARWPPASRPTWW